MRSHSFGSRFAPKRSLSDADESLLDALLATVCLVIAIVAIVGCVAMVMPR